MEKIKVKSLFSLAIPIFFELLLVIIVGNVDTIMLGYYDTNAVGTLGGMGQILNIQNVIFGFINLATSILCAQYIGAQNKNKLQEIIAVSLVINLGLGILMGAFYFLNWKFFLIKINLPFKLLEMGKNYFKLVGGLCVFQAITLTCSAVMKSYGNPKFVFFINVGVNILNIIGNGLFIFGWFGAPILGVTGVGISTVVSRGIGCIISFFVMSKYCKFKFRKKLISPFPKDTVKKILSIGIPTAGENLAWNIGQVLIVSMVNTMGASVIAAKTYLTLISSFGWIFSASLGQATAIQVGQLIGAKEIEMAYSKCLKSLGISMLFSLISVGIIVFFKEKIMILFTKDRVILEITLKVFPILLFLEIGRVFNIVVINSLHAAGDIKFPMMMGIGSVFLIAVPLSYILGIKFEWSLVGIWVANGMDEWIRGITMYFRWKRKKWINKSFVEEN